MPLKNNSKILKFKQLLLCFGFFVTHCVYSQNLSIHFDFGSSKILNTEKNRLDSLLKSMNPEARYKVKLIGHTDSIGSHDNNLGLSEKRANALKTFLSKSPIEMHFETVGRSYNDPLQKNDSDEGKALNRRCDIHLEIIPESLPQWETQVTMYRVASEMKNILYTKNGCQVIIAPGSFAVQNTDTVQIHITEYKDPVDFLIGGLPMSYEKNGKTYMYESEQMMKIEAFVNHNPVNLVKLIGLKCPHIDTSRGVKFYEFKGKANKTPLARLREGFGRVEYIPIEPVLEKEEKPLTAEKEHKKPAATTTTNKEAPAASKSKESGPVRVFSLKRLILSKIEKPKAGKSTKVRSQPEDALILQPDTGKSFILEPDTGRIFRFYSRSITSTQNTAVAVTYAHTCYPCHESFCDTTSFKKLVHRGLKWDMKPSFSLDIDFRSYYERYKNLNYDGLSIKPQKDSAHLFSVKTKFRKRFLHKDLILNIRTTGENTEYEPLQSTKWILHYGRRQHKLSLLKKLKVSDLRILQLKDKTHFLIELKADTMFYAFEGKAKKRQKNERRYKDYIKIYEKRVRKFDDSLKRYFNLHHDEIDSLFCLFQFTEYLSQPSWKWVPCFDAPKPKPACYPFSFFEPRYKYKYKYPYYGNCKDIASVIERHRKNNTMPTYQEICDFDCFGDWISYYKNHKEEFTNMFQKVQKDSMAAWRCVCTVSGHPESGRKSPCPNEVWQPNAAGDAIVYIGLGVYNFDREMYLENTQDIPSPTYLNRNNDTILKCNININQYSNTNEWLCRHQTYSIISGFNGLLEQVYTEKLTLVLGKVNVLFFTDPLLHKYYKLRLDLRDQKEPLRQTTFSLEDITKSAGTTESLKDKLLEK